MTDAAAIDAYLARLPDEQRAALQRVREQVARLVPRAVEGISYNMPTFKLHGRAILWYAGWKKHCSIYPLTDWFMAEHADELRGYTQTKGSLHFTPHAPLPDALLEKLVLARVADVEAAGP